MTSTAAKASWTQLPAVLLGQTATWLGDARSLVAVQATCSSWKRLPTEKLDLVWKSLYLHEFEPESATDPCIAPEASTSWKQRFVARSRVDQNLREGEFVVRDLDWPGAAFCTAPKQHIVAGYSSEYVVVKRLADGKESLRWQLSDSWEVNGIRLDDSSDPPLIAVHCTGDGAKEQVCAFDLRTGEKFGQTLPFQRSEFDDLRWRVHGLHVVVVKNEKASVWSLATGKKVHELNDKRLGGSLDVFFNATSGSLFTQRSFEVDKFSFNSSDYASAPKSGSHVEYDARRERFLIFEKSALKQWDGKTREPRTLANLTLRDVKFSALHFRGERYVLCANKGELTIIDTRATSEDKQRRTLRFRDNANIPDFPTCAHYTWRFAVLRYRPKDVKHRSRGYALLVLDFASAVS